MRRMFAMGLDPSGKPLYPAVDEEDFARAVERAATANVDALRGPAARAPAAFAQKGVVQTQAVDPSDPRKMGWTWLVGATDPNRAEYARILAPLAERRGAAAGAPLVLEPDADWLEWMTNEYLGLYALGTPPPHYVMIVGGPEHVPFGFQAILDTAASVGRVAFDTLKDLEAYVAKLLRLEAAAEPVVERDVLLFATDGGEDDPTWYSRRYMAEPLAEHVKAKLGYPVRTLMGDEATRGNLIEALLGRRPALVYTASHGMAAPAGGLEAQRKLTGAICCHREGFSSPWLFTAEDVPKDDVPFLEGSVFFQFACFGAGTPSVSGFAHWLPESFGVAKKIAERDLVSALPKRLLAHPRGPVAFVGHVDTAWLHGFADPRYGAPLDGAPWDRRIAPFKLAIDALLGAKAGGLAMTGFNQVYGAANARIVQFVNQKARGQIKDLPRALAALADTFIYRGDAENYVLLGDPGVHVIIPA